MGATESCSICFFTKKDMRPALETDKLIGYAPPKMPESEAKLAPDSEKLENEEKTTDSVNSGEREAFLAAVAAATDRFLKIAALPVDQTYDLATDKEGCKVYTKDSLGGYIIRAEWKAPFTPRAYLDFLSDSDKRKSWDPNVEELRMVETVDADVSIYYQSYKKIMAMSSRDLVLICKKFEIGNALIDVFCSVEASACPQRPGYVRANIVTGGYYLEDLSQGSNVPLTRVISYSEGSCGGLLPKSVVKRVSAGNVPVFVKQLNDALKVSMETNSLS